MLNKKTQFGQNESLLLLLITGSQADSQRGIHEASDVLLCRSDYRRLGRSHRYTQGGT